MDLLKELSKKINFTYSLALSPDGQFGNYIIKNTSGIDMKLFFLKYLFQHCTMSRKNEILGISRYNLRISTLTSDSGLGYVF